MTGGPFRYKTFARESVEKNRAIATHPVKQAVIAVEKDIRGCFDAGAVRVSIDFTEGRLANKNDSRNPWTNKDMLQGFIDLNN